MKTEITRNTLSINQSIKLSSWLNTKKTQPDWKEMSIDKLLPLAVKDLGFNIVERNLRSVAKATEISLPARRVNGIKSSSKNLTRHKIGLLRKGLLELYESLGQTAPDYLHFEN